ncbi:hypothetical protein E2I00_007424, partial [Balaenoptera physalus]
AQSGFIHASGVEQDTSLLLAITVTGISVLLLALKNKNVKKRRPITLQHPEAKFLLPLIEKEQISYNTRRFRFGLPSPDHAFGLPVGNYVNLLARIDGVLVIRAYTPVSSDEDLGFVDLIMKIYFKNVHPNHPEGGKMTQYLENMKTGDTILFQGPSRRLFYHGSGTGGFTLGLQLGGRRCLWLFHCSRKLLRFESHGLVLERAFVVSEPQQNSGPEAAGSPQARVGWPGQERADLCVESGEQAGRPGGTEEEILVSKELEEVARTHPKQFNLWYTLDGPPVGWKYISGFITEDTIKEHLPPPGRFSFILACGPPPVIQRAAHPNLEKLGYNKDMIFTY